MEHIGHYFGLYFHSSGRLSAFITLFFFFFHIHIPTYIHIFVWHFPAFVVFVHSDIKGGWGEGVWFGLVSPEAMASFGCVSLLGRFLRSYDGDVLFLSLCSLYNGVLFLTFIACNVMNACLCEDFQDLISFARKLTGL